MQDRLPRSFFPFRERPNPESPGDQPFPSLPAKGPRPAALLCLIEFIGCFSHLLQKGFRSAPPNDSHERIAARGAASAPQKACRLSAIRSMAGFGSSAFINVFAAFHVILCRAKSVLPHPTFQVNPDQDPEFQGTCKTDAPGHSS